MRFGFYWAFISKSGFGDNLERFWMQIDSRFAVFPFGQNSKGLQLEVLDERHQEEVMFRSGQNFANTPKYFL